MSIPVNNSGQEPTKAYGDELPPGTQLCGGQYTIERYLNSGGFGITYLAHDSLGRKVVIKECFPGAMCCRQQASVRLRSKSGGDDFGKILNLFEKEARALADLSHPSIVGVHQIFKDNNTAYMALDFIPGRDLLQIIEDDRGGLTPSQVKGLLIKLLDAISYIHENGILHRDISPDNILMESDGSPVLIDFGAARESATRVSRVLSKVLTVKDGYSPQEFYLVGGEQRPSSDLYAMAATFYHLITGKAPPSSQVRLAAVAGKRADPLIPLGHAIKGYDTYFLEAINRCLGIFPDQRIQSAAEWLDVIDTDRRERKQGKASDIDDATKLAISQAVLASQQGSSPATGQAARKLVSGAANIGRKEPVDTSMAPVSHDISSGSAPRTPGQYGTAKSRTRPLGRVLSGTTHLFRSLNSRLFSSREVHK